MSVNSQALAPRTTIMMRRDPKVISDATYQKCAQYIIDSVGIGIWFDGIFNIDGVEFDICCQIFRSPFIEDNDAITGVRFYRAFAETYGRDGYMIDNDFTDAELEKHIKS